MKDGDVIDIKVVVDDDMIEIFMGEKLHLHIVYMRKQNMRSA